MMYTVKRRLKLHGQIYERGDTVTSEQIGRARTETVLKNLNRIMPVTVAPETAELMEAPSTPPRHKGGRPRKIV